MTDLFTLICYNSKDILVYKDLLCVQNAKTLSLREIHQSNVLLNYLKCLYIFCSIDVLLLDGDFVWAHEE